MAIESLTYAAIAERLGISSEAARALVKRLKLPRSRGNTGKAVVQIDLDEIDHTALTTRSPGGHQAVIADLKAKIEALQADIAKLEALGDERRENFERERERAEGLVSELLRSTADAMAAREAAARLEGELEILRRPWWTRLIS